MLNWAMSWFSNPFPISMFSLGSSAILIGWGVSYLIKKDRKEHVKDIVLLIALGLTDLAGAKESQHEVTAIQDLVGPRHLNAEQLRQFTGALKKYDGPKRPVTLHIDVNGTEHEQDEQMRFGHELEAAIKGEGWDVTATAVRLQSPVIGVIVTMPRAPTELMNEIARTQRYLYEGFMFSSAFTFAQVFHTIDVTEATSGNVTISVGRQP